MARKGIKLHEPVHGLGLPPGGCRPTFRRASRRRAEEHLALFRLKHPQETGHHRRFPAPRPPGDYGDLAAQSQGDDLTLGRRERAPGVLLDPRHRTYRIRGSPRGLSLEQPQEVGRHTHLGTLEWREQEAGLALNGVSPDETIGCHGVRRTRKLWRAQQRAITTSRTPAFHKRSRSWTMRQRFTLLLTGSIRSRRPCRAWLAHLRLSRLKLAGPPSPRDTEASNAYAVMHDSLGPVCMCSFIGINAMVPHKYVGEDQHRDACREEHINTFETSALTAPNVGTCCGFLIQERWTGHQCYTGAADPSYSTASRPSREAEKGCHRGKGSRHAGHAKAGRAAGGCHHER